MAYVVGIIVGLLFAFGSLLRNSGYRDPVSNDHMILGALISFWISYGMSYMLVMLVRNKNPGPVGLRIYWIGLAVLVLLLMIHELLWPVYQLF